MTIRERLNRRASIAAWPACALALGTVAMIFLSPSEFALRVSVVFLVLVCLLLLSTIFTLKCLRCGGPLASLVGHFCPFRRLGRKVMCCPFCAANLDEPDGL